MLQPVPEGMTRQQKSTLVALGVLNAIVVCCGCALLLFAGGGTSSRQALLPTSTRTPTETATLEPTLAPQPTNTLVLRPPPTLPPRSVTPRSRLEADWKFYDASPEGFGMALPSTWQKINFNQDFLASYFQTLKDKNPKFATAFQGMSNQLATLQIKFFAIDTSEQAVSSNYVTSMNALREPLPFDMSLDSYVQANLTTLNKAGLANKTPTRRRVSYSAGAAEEIKYQASATSVGNERVTISVLQYLLVRGKFGYVVTFGTTPDKDKTYAPTFQKMMQSFQWVP